jgi:protein-disulfide isomerase
MSNVNGRVYRAVIIVLCLGGLLMFSFSSINAMMKGEDGVTGATKKHKQEKVAPAIKATDDNAIAKMMEDRVVGKDDAPITILGYSSFTCGHCGNFHMKTLPEIKKKFVETGRARFIFRDFPLEGKAAAASMLTRCAPAESYDKVLDVFFGGQSEWIHSSDAKAALSGYVSLLGMTKEDTDKCLANEDLLKALMKMREEGMVDYNITATPTFVIQKGMHQEMVRGAAGLAKFEEIIKKMEAM